MRTTSQATGAASWGSFRMSFLRSICGQVFEGVLNLARFGANAC
jgi:hypothetical protein